MAFCLLRFSKSLKPPTGPLMAFVPLSLTLSEGKLTCNGGCRRSVLSPPSRRSPPRASSRSWTSPEISFFTSRVSFFSHFEADNFWSFTIQIGPHHIVDLIQQVHSVVGSVKWPRMMLNETYDRLGPHQIQWELFARCNVTFQAKAGWGQPSGLMCLS